MVTVMDTRMRTPSAVETIAGSLVGDVFVVFGVGSSSGVLDVPGWRTTLSGFYPAVEADVYLAYRVVESNMEEVDFGLWGLDPNAAMVFNHLRFDTPVSPSLIDYNIQDQIGVHFAMQGFYQSTDSNTVLGISDGSYAAWMSPPESVPGAFCITYAAAGDPVIPASSLSFNPPVDWNMHLASSENVGGEFAVASYSKNLPGAHQVEWTSNDPVHAFLTASVVLYEVTEIVSRLKWDESKDRTFQTGVDRGVFFPNSGGAVAWNGITGVDESGSDSAVAYYVDGRPFLYFPKPKEYSGTIKAYTYPDEFSEILGMAEATAGMYLDSQVGDSFGFSYRTLVGGIQGIGNHYKIHLVYNATVTPGGISYDTIGSSINPVDFSFAIQAVPLPIQGYRPTAHIVIDSLNMDADKLAEIETLIYGTDGIPARLPPPQEIFDILSFGDTIIITDFGDGTWQAEGASKNVYMTDEGTFRIDNVDAVDNGDGTYDVSTTIP